MPRTGAKLLSHLPIALAFFTVALSCGSVASISVSDGQRTDIDVSGSIDPICKVSNNVRNRATKLDLSVSKRQRTNRIFIWCNTGQSTAQTTYSSLNQGYLVNANGNKIPYLVTIPQTISGADLTTPKTVSQRTGHGLKGQNKGRNVHIIPQVTGFEYAGTYRDTIRVTVSYN